MTVHFVYAVPPVKSKLSSLYDRMSLKSKNLSRVYRNSFLRFIDWPDPIHAPYSITFHLLYALEKKYKVKLYDLREKVSIKMKTDDLLLAHLYPDTSCTPWNKPDYEMVGYRTIKENPDKRAVIISPYNHDEKQVGWLKEVFQLKKDLRFIPICGSYWMKKWEDSPLNLLIDKENIFKVNMAIDSTEYPFVKTTFSPKGKRKFLYIGRTDYPKNISALENIASAYEGFDGSYIGSGNIKGWKKISDFAQLNRETIENLARKFDFFLSTSEADAQATTILEQMSIGLGIACTPESGYDYSSFIRLDKNDTAFNCSQIQVMQEMDEAVILEMTRKNRRIVEEEHSWEKFTSDVCKFIRN